MHPVTLQHQCKNCVQQEQGLTEFNRYPQLTMTSFENHLYLEALYTFSLYVYGFLRESLN